MKPGVFQGKKFPFTPKRRKKSLGSQCNNIIDTRHDLAAFRSKLANVSWLRSYRWHFPCLSPRFIGGFAGFDWWCSFGFHRYHNWRGFALVCTWAQAPPHGCCTGGELWLGEVVAIQDGFEKEELSRSRSPRQSQGRATRRPEKKMRTWRRRKRRSKSCGASAINYLWDPGMG